MIEPSTFYDGSLLPGQEHVNTLYWSHTVGGFPDGANVKDSTCQCRRFGFDPWVGKTPWRRKWQPTPVSLPGESNGQRSLAGRSPWGRKETQLHNGLPTGTHTHTQRQSALALNVQESLAFLSCKVEKCTSQFEQHSLRN